MTGEQQNRAALFGFLLTSLLFTHPAGALWGDELAPIATGGVIDRFPKDGRADEVDDVAFIINSDSRQQRAIVEFDLSSVRAGTILSASLTGRVAANNSLDRGPREHLVEVYTGNGLVDLADYDVPGIEIGRFAHDAGDSTEFDFSITGILHNLLVAGANALGMRISPLSADMPPDVLGTNELFTPPRLHFEVLPLGAKTVQLVLHFDASVERDDGPFQLVEGEVGVSAQRIDFANIDRRAILEYDLSDIPANAQITDAKIEFDIRGFSGGQEDGPDAPLYGYSGDGIAAIDDALLTTNPIGELSVRDTGPAIADIDHEFIQSLLGTTNFFGLAVHGDPDFDGLSFASLEFGAPPFFIPPARLSLTYLIPTLAGDENGDGIVDAADYVVWRKNDGAQEAYNTWRANFGQSVGVAAASRAAESPSRLGEPTAAVPEPNAVLLLVVGVGGVLLRSRSARWPCDVDRHRRW